MAVFKEAFDKVLKHEGGYANVPGDSGLETYMGVSRKFFPDWKGWAIVDRNKPLKHNQRIVSSELDGLLSEFYRLNFWDNMRGTEIKDQQVANFIFDWHVNSGRTALIQVQRTIGAIDDGIFGVKTIQAINNHFGELLGTLKLVRIQFVRNIVKNNPSQSKFLSGLLSRINSF
jgi:lysozyme family protein